MTYDAHLLFSHRMVVHQDQVRSPAVDFLVVRGPWVHQTGVDLLSGNTCSKIDNYQSCINITCENLSLIWRQLKYCKDFHIDIFKKLKQFD